jgi:hypothetical protein
MASWGRISFGMLACVAACAGSQQSAAPARKPAETAAPATGYMQLDSNAPPATPPAGAAPARPPAVDVGSSSAGQSTSEELTRRSPEAADPHGPSGARVRLAEARRELEIATSERDCARACRALESMERAARQVCDLARSSEERRECTSASEQVDKARSKVQAACGGCPQKLR